MSFEERIRSSYPLHSQLITTLSTTSNASSRAHATTQYINDLRSRIDRGTKNLRALRSRVNRLRSEYEVLRDSHAKRLICKVSGKMGEHEARINNAENAYQDALEEQARATKDMETLYSSLKDANKDLLNARDQAAIHNFTIVELDTLHNTLFPPSTTIPSSPSFPFNPTRLGSPTTRTPYTLEVRANAQINTLTNGPLAKLRSQIKHEKRVLEQLCEARKSLIWAHAAILDAEDADRHSVSAIYEYRALGLVLVRTTLGVAQCHAVRGAAAYEAARALRAAGGGEGRSRDRDGSGGGDGEEEMPALREMIILNEMCLMSTVSYPLSPTSPVTFSPGSLLATGSGSVPGLGPVIGPGPVPGHGPRSGSVSGSGSRPRAQSSSSTIGGGGGGGVGGSGGSSSINTVRRLLEEKDLAARVAECKAEMKPVIVRVRREIAAAEARVAALEDGKRALESEARDLLRRARIGVVELVISGEGDREGVGGGGGEGAMGGGGGGGEINHNDDEEEEEEVQVFMGGPPDYTP